MLNAKDYGVPQNRERAFMFSFLGEWDYEFPEPVKLEKRLKDVLEDKVDEKYYINNEKAKQLIDKLIKENKIFTEQNRTEQNRITVDLTINSPKETKIANCICARVDCGISNQKQFGNGVIEKL